MDIKAKEFKKFREFKEFKTNDRKIKIMEKQAFSFQDIYAWQKAHAFVLLVYHVTQHYPKEELFGLTS